MKNVFRADTEVDWAEFQAAKVRVKRDPIRSEESNKVRDDSRLVDNLLQRKVNSYIYFYSKYRD